MTFEEAAINEFLTGKIVQQDLDPFGISELTVVVAGVRVQATWYSGWMAHPRSLRVGNESYPVGAHKIIKTAMKRADSLVGEKLRYLDALVADE